MGVMHKELIYIMGEPYIILNPPAIPYKLILLFVGIMVGLVLYGIMK
jgi:hypothetical protein